MKNTIVKPTTTPAVLAPIKSTPAEALAALKALGGRKAEVEKLLGIAQAAEGQARSARKAAKLASEELTAETARVDAMVAGS